ncbi:MAG TPA: outer membrane lipoprotein carrier protein LolA [Pseudonocardia sp.]|jgi:outer membrane lipoprotein-sorting protein|uniref:LolA family protein n=1 Tax=Pseudonocardia sp. TaxID=60912 RepID=UPI002B4ADB47|nr:outer membrane lipoprotein carrier protein LolA [Pseudonocardia sp.]HLU58986.1 outer membrane lipoprotein carrier protein LolA [Pseudonocardia sp.]
MATARSSEFGRAAAAGIAVAGVVGLGLLAVPAGAGAQPALPPVDPEELVRSVLAADPQPLAGAVELDNDLGLPALPGLPQAGNGTSTARIWSDGDRRGRVQLPTDSGERTLVSDGETFWSWNSEDRTVRRVPKGEHDRDAGDADPGATAAKVLAKLQPTSLISVDGTSEVAGRPAYELVLAPRPTERTLLREVRVAVDAEHRMPLRLTVLATGSPDPAVEVGFTDLSFGPQDPELFRFTPPPGAKVEDAQRPEGHHNGDSGSTTVGDGWDTVVVAAAPPSDADRPEGVPELAELGRPVTGPWGSGRLITSAVASVIVTDDGRIAAGAVPEQVLSEALTR